MAHDGGKRYRLEGSGIGVLGRSRVIVRHSDGCRVLAWVVGARDRGWDGSLAVESVMGDLAPLTGVAAVTAGVWVVGDPLGHPAAAVAAYAPNGDRAALAEVIGTIFEPAWYRTDPNRPERRARVEARLGLTPRWDRSGSKVRDTVTAAWLGDGDTGPADFFSRKFFDMLAAGRERHYAERQIGKYYIKCLLAAWTDPQRPKGSEPMFDPRLLFDREAVEAVGTKT